ncbi:MAG TPA: hypothetical protein VFN67_32840 [Polyangiales bacterium]|nr:hypothetical protein [Polyangiales bacterium]
MRFLTNSETFAVVPGKVRTDLISREKSAFVTSDMGAPPIGSLPWQLAHFFATTADTSHGSASVELASGAPLPAARSFGVPSGDAPVPALGVTTGDITSGEREPLLPPVAAGARAPAADGD